jgi:hypothetical protein
MPYPPICPGRQVEEASCPMDADLADLLVCGRPVTYADERELAPGSIVDLASFSHGRGTRERQGDFEVHSGRQAALCWLTVIRTPGRTG